jgi:hypothetical protein
MTTPGSTGPPPNPLPEPGATPGPSLFQLPQFYWNHLTTVPMDPTQGEPEQRGDFDFEFDLQSQSATGHTPEMPPPMPYPHDGVRGMHPSASDNVNVRNMDMQRYPPPPPPHTNGSEPPFIPPSAAWAGAPVMGPHAGPQDQAAIYAALMSYMVEAAKTS